MTTAPALPATTLEDNCYNGMFYGCTSLTSAPALPATTLTNYCYCGMFVNCTSLTTAPALPATTISSSSYGSMFSGCTSLTAMPTLNITNIDDCCCTWMFYGCTSLTSATIPNIDINEYDYVAISEAFSEMFKGCINLDNVTCLIEDYTSDDEEQYDPFHNWLNDVASTGTISKYSSLVVPIPDGWTVTPLTNA